ncbi:hypothetical protein BWI17_06585 [Betaproteobacteria bacterium GR16-43]|nr:hypothetical protein BWI17_06585 [Betaproteobacteria bacterium GR16-43]
MKPAHLARLALLLLAVPMPASASFLSGEALDTMANVISWIVLIFVPIGAIVLFWLVHVMPEKIAEKNHHPQSAAIKTLCLLSLFFGGLLWPIAWLWAYTKPVAYRMAYGTDKHEHYYVHMAERAERGELDEEQLDHLRAEFFSMAERGALSDVLKAARDRTSKSVAGRAAPGPAASTSTTGGHA